MKNKGTSFHKVSWFESYVVALLVIVSCLRAGMADGGSVLSFLHAATLVSFFILVSALLQRMHRLLARAWFSLFSILILVEIAIQAFTGLHVNWFVISLLLQPNGSNQIGLSLPLVIITAIAASALLWLSSVKLRRFAFQARPRALVATAAALFASTQLLYAVAYFDGAAQILQARRMLPIFWAPHPYRSNKLLESIFGPRGSNPFSTSQVQQPASAFDGFQELDTTTDLSQAPNILLIVADSLRSVDIAKDRSIAPNLFNAAKTGDLLLDYYSVSNCTHFSMFSMLTGELAVGYGPARRAKSPLGVVPTLARAGYNVSTAESGSLDWYDLSEILLPAETERFIASGTDALENDIEATNNTIQMIKSWPSRDQPSFHLTFLEGTHYPYSNALETSGASNLERYKSAITLFDQQLGRILNAVDDLPEGRSTLILISSDHGEEFQDDGVVGHASRLSDKQTKVPLVVLGAQTDTSQLQSHLDIPEFVLDELGLSQGPRSSNKVILANCDYDYPSGFAIFQDGKRFDFVFDDGYLVPTLDTFEQHDSTVIMGAARDLLKAINSIQPQTN